MIMIRHGDHPGNEYGRKIPKEITNSYPECRLLAREFILIKRNYLCPYLPSTTKPSISRGEKLKGNGDWKAMLLAGD